MPKADIWMPLYIGDYLADTARLTTEQHGAYFLLIMDYWRSGPPPDDDCVLAQITRLSADAWSNARGILLAYFKHVDGYLVHSRIDREKTCASESKEKAVAKATAAASKRWGKDAPSNACSMLDDCPLPSPSPSPSPLPLQTALPSNLSAPSQAETSTAKTTRAKRAVVLPQILNRQLVDDWVTLRKSKRAAITSTVIEGIEREAGEAGISLEAALRVCCERGWQSFKADWYTSSGGDGKTPLAYMTPGQRREAVTDKSIADWLADSGPQEEKTINGEVVK